MRVLCWANLILAILAALAPVAHVLELPSKLALDGPLWLAVQQHLYRGWGPLLGGPAEIGALATTLALLVVRRADRRMRGLTLQAAIAYAGMLAVFFVFNAPVNAAVNRWTATTLPGDWPAYRLRWETGHALAALLAAVGLAVLVRAYFVEATARRWMPRIDLTQKRSCKT
ncbi:MAG TPA: hypothetical protein VGJ20_26865 [Xanthobacteraceae bacterium]|jgi:hypothetical protein